jgi:two-component system sensor histidine kinase DegS
MAEIQNCQGRLDELKEKCGSLEEAATRKTQLVLESLSTGLNDDIKGAIRNGYHEISSEVYSVASVREKINQISLRIEFEDSLFSHLKNSVIDMNTLIRNLQGSDGEDAFLVDSSPGNPLPISEARETEKSVLLLQEEEKKNLAVVIHDEFVQSLANMVMKVDFAKKQIRKNPSEAEEELLAVRREMQKLLDFVKRLIFDMSPMSMADLGFVPTVERFVQSSRLTSPYKILFELQGIPFDVSEFTSIVLFRIIQETVTNVSSHSCAKKVVVRVDYSDTSKISLTITDDGIGFDITKLPDLIKMGRVGIHTMKSRIDLLDGTFDIESVPGEGTTIKVVVPVRE